MTHDPPAPLLVDEQTAARLLSVSPRTMWQLAHDGRIPVVRVGSTKRYAVDTLRQWIDEQQKRGAAQ